MGANVGNSTRHKKITRKSISKISSTIDMPDLLEVQLKSFADFLQENVPIEKRENRGLHAVFKSIFPIPPVYIRFFHKPASALS